MFKDYTEYKSGDKTCRGFIAVEDKNSRNLPAIVVAHAWKGQDDIARKKAEELAGLGYVGFAADIFGDGKTAENDEEALKLILPFFLDRGLLRERIISAVEAAKKLTQVDPDTIGAIGFCFGGLTVIELLRSGTPIIGAASFHGLLGYDLGGNHAKALPIAEGIKGSLLILHGHDDPFVSQDDIQNIQKELTKAQVDWQMNIYGHAAHAFTNPHEHNVAKGLVFNERANHRSWEAMRFFFKDLIAKRS